METDRTKLFDMAIAMSDSFYKKKDFENAFKELIRATLYVNKPSEQPEYLWKLRIIYEKQAEICINEPNPKYDFFIIYYLVAFALDIARDLTSFPHLNPFYYRKGINYNPDSGDDDDDQLNLSLKKLNILKFKKNILKEYGNFIYSELPIIYGIPIKYDEDSVKRIFDSMTTNPDEYFGLMSFSEELKAKSIDIVPFKTYDFVSKLLQAYYDMENS